MRAKPAAPAAAVFTNSLRFIPGSFFMIDADMFLPPFFASLNHFRDAEIKP
jgi:hypothetical protein